MSLHAIYSTLLDYHWHTTSLLAERAAGLEAALINQPRADGVRSIHDLFFHLLAADFGWRGALETGTRPAPPSPEAYKDLDALRQGLADERKAWARYLEGLDDASLEAEATLVSSGRQVVLPRWRILQHLVLHGMQHHAELAQELTAMGRSPGDLDFIFFS